MAEISNKIDYQTRYFKEETEREARLHTEVIKRTVDKMRRALRMEVSRGELSPPIRDKFIITPLEFLSKAYTKINLEMLYRRYRHVRIQALTECLGIVGAGGTREENLENIKKKIVKCGEAYKASKKREESKSKCAAS